MKLISEARYLAAHELYIEILIRVDEAIDFNEEGKKAMKNSLHCEQHIMTLLKRTAEVKQALDYHDTSDDWIYGSSMLGITSYYRTSPGDNCITIKMEGAIEDLPTIEQFAVLKRQSMSSLTKLKSMLPISTLSVRKLKKFFIS